MDESNFLATVPLSGSERVGSNQREAAPTKENRCLRDGFGLASS